MAENAIKKFLNRIWPNSLAFANQTSCNNIQPKNIDTSSFNLDIMKSLLNKRLNKFLFKITTL